MSAAPEPPDPAMFLHVRVVLSMVVSLSIARLLSGLAVFVQHPGRLKPSAVHLLWVASMLLLVVDFWWWQFRLAHLAVWRFEIYVFVLFYAALNYLLCAILFPNDLDEYAGWSDYFISRRRWFFGLLAAAFLLDIIDTLIKGSEHWTQLSGDYLVQVPIGLALCLIAYVSARRWVHLSLASVHILYQCYWIGRVVYTMG